MRVCERMCVGVRRVEDQIRRMDYLAVGRIQSTQPSMIGGGKREQCCGPDECQRCLGRYIQSRGCSQEHAGHNPPDPPYLDSNA